MAVRARVKPRNGPPLDFSFKELSNLQDALYEEAESGFPKLAPLVHIDPENPDETPRQAALPPRPDVQFNTVVIRLGNNKLQCLDGLHPFLRHVMDDPMELMWLDLSCNHLDRIEDALCSFTNLQICWCSSKAASRGDSWIQVLYLHGNRIDKLSEIEKLAKLPKLTKLSLHGNPVSDKAIYKQYTVGYLPNLKSLDFGAITRVDRDKIDTWFRGHVKRVENRT